MSQYWKNIPLPSGWTEHEPERDIQFLRTKYTRTFRFGPKRFEISYTIPDYLDDGSPREGMFMDALTRFWRRIGAM